MECSMYNAIPQAEFINLRPSSNKYFPRRSQVAANEINPPCVVESFNEDKKRSENQHKVNKCKRFFKRWHRSSKSLIKTF